MPNHLEKQQKYEEAHVVDYQLDVLHEAIVATKKIIHDFRPVT